MDKTEYKRPLSQGIEPPRAAESTPPGSTPSESTPSASILSDESHASSSGPAGRVWHAVPTPARQSIGALLGAALGLTLVVGLVVGLRTFAHLALTAPTPSLIAAATPEPELTPLDTPAPSPAETAAATPTPTDTPTPTPTPSPTATPYDGPTTPEHPNVLASVDCLFLGPADSIGSRLYAACAGNHVVAIDLATDKVVKTYTISHPSTRVAATPNQLHVKDALWIQWSDRLIQRYDLNSGKLTGSTSGNRLVPDAGGGVWILTADGVVHAVSARTGMPASAASGATFPSAWVCGASIWTWKDGTMTVTSTAGAPKGSFAIAGGFNVVKAGAACWLAIGNASRGYDLTNLAASCLGARTIHLRASPFELGSTVWMLTGGGMIQLVMPAGGTTGSVWKLPGGLGLDQPPVVASGQVWTGSSTKFVRLDIPLRAVSGGSIPPTVCPSPTPTPTPTATATSTPGATPTPTPTPTPTA